MRLCQTASNMEIVNVGKFIIVCRKPIFYLFYLEHLVAYSARKSCTHIETQKHDARETSYLFQRISIMLQRFNFVLLHDTAS